MIIKSWQSLACTVFTQVFKETVLPLGVLAGVKFWFLEKSQSYERDIGLLPRSRSLTSTIEKQFQNDCVFGMRYQNETLPIRRQRLEYLGSQMPIKEKW